MAMLAWLSEVKSEDAQDRYLTWESPKKTIFIKALGMSSGSSHSLTPMVIMELRSN